MLKDAAKVLLFPSLRLVLSEVRRRPVLQRLLMHSFTASSAVAAGLLARLLPRSLLRASRQPLLVLHSQVAALRVVEVAALHGAAIHRGRTSRIA